MELGKTGDPMPPERGRDRTMESLGTSKADQLPVVSFVIPCFNASQYLVKCLQSVIDFASVPCEIVVVDDGSTEDIQAIVNRFVPLVRCVRQPNSGPGAARNRGIAETAGKYVRFLDADDFLLPTTGLRDQIDVLDTHLDVGLVYGAAIIVNAQGRAFRVRKPSFAKRAYVHPGKTELDELLFHNYITTSTTLVRRRVIEQIGPFRSDLQRSEDWEYWLRLAQVSAIGYVPKCLAAYRIHEKSIIARDSLTNWADSHTKILEELYAEPAFATHYGRLRHRVYAKLDLAVAKEAFNEGHVNLARRFAKNVLQRAQAQRLWRYTAESLWLLFRSVIPWVLSQPSRKTARRFTHAVRRRHKRLGQYL